MWVLPFMLVDFLLEYELADFLDFPVRLLPSKPVDLLLAYLDPLVFLLEYALSISS